MENSSNRITRSDKELEVMRDFIKLQHKELEARLSETKVRQDSIAANKDIAVKSIEATAESEKITGTNVYVCV